MAIQINAIEVSPLGDEALQVAVVEGIHLIGQQFIVLTDTPSLYGSSHSLVKMNSTGDGLDYTPAADGVVIDNASIRLDIDSLTSTPSITSSSIVAISTGGVHNSVNLEDAIQSYTNFISLSDTPASFGPTQSLVKVNTAGDGLDYTPAAAGIAIDNASIRMDIDSLPAASTLTSEAIIASSNSGTHEAIVVQDIIEGSLTETEFFAAAEDRKRNNAGSGFLEWGRHVITSTHEPINQGLYSHLIVPNILTMERNTDGIGVSRTDAPIALVNGTQHKISKVNASGTYNASFLKFPDAPDGTKTYDSATGAIVQHTDAATAFAAETTTNKVITTRKDLVFLETWHEAISEKDIVVPLGNVQYGELSYNDITLVDLDTIGVSQQYSAFGEWDSSTQGKGSRWSSLSDSEKATYIADPENNIYFDSVVKSYIQVRYRIRVIEGMGDEWDVVRPTTLGGRDLKYDLSTDTYIKPRGRRVGFFKDIDDDGGSGGDGYGIYTWPWRDWSGVPNPYHDYGRFVSNNTATGDNYKFSSSSEAHALPIALVQRLNQGAYHPVYNSEGCDTFGGSDQPWYEYIAVTSVLQCFTDASGNGAIGELTGREGKFEFHDAIYAGLVEDLRLNANKLDYDRLLEDTMRKSIAGVVRGKGKVPFTNIRAENQTVIDASADNIRVDDANVYDIGQFVTIFTSGSDTIRVKIKSKSSTNIFWSSLLYGTIARSSGLSYVFAETLLTSEYDELPWVDIIGEPAFLLTSYPNGVIGRWIPDLSSTLSLNVKGTYTSVVTIYEINTGGPLTRIAPSINAATNTIVFDASLYHGLVFYESLSNFTESSDNSPLVSGVGDVYASCFNVIGYGNRLQPSLTGGIGKATGGIGIPYGTFSTTKHKFYGTGDEHLNTLSPFIHPTHEPLDISQPNNGSDGFKTLPTMIEKNGLLYLQYHFSELNYVNPTTISQSHTNTTWTDGVLYRVTSSNWSGVFRCDISWSGQFAGGTLTMDPNGDIIHIGDTLKYFTRLVGLSSWGDDSTIPILDGESVKTDLNGEVNIVGCHHSLIPIGIANSNQTN